MRNIFWLKVSEKKDRGIEGLRESHLTLNSYPSIPPALHTSKRHAAFTMAEILISLTIIGIIAAITLPSLVGNIREKSWDTQRKALYSRMSQAISMMPSLNGYGTYEGTWDNDVVTVTKDTAAQAFVTEGLAKVLNINNICSIPMSMTNAGDRHKKLEKCGIPDKITVFGKSGKKNNFPTNLSELNPMFTSTFYNAGRSYFNPLRNINTNVAAFETHNGESIAVFYNPYCRQNIYFRQNMSYMQPNMCANFIYDLNGKKGPNKMGKDIGFITALYTNTDIETFAPIPAYYNEKSISQLSVAAACRDRNEHYRVPNIYELMAIFYNMRLFSSLSGSYWSSTLFNNNSAWALQGSTGRILYAERNQEYYSAFCIERY